MGSATSRLCGRRARASRRARRRAWRWRPATAPCWRCRPARRRPHRTWAATRVCGPFGASLSRRSGSWTSSPSPRPASWRTTSWTWTPSRGHDGAGGVDLRSWHRCSTVLDWSGARRRGLHAAPEEVREPPEHAGGRRPAPRFRAIANREVGDERRAEGDGEAGVGPLLEPRRHRGKQQHHAEELGPRELHPEVGGEAEVGERLRHLRQAQLRVGGEAYLQAEERGDDPEADDHSFGAGHAQVSTRNRFAYSALNLSQPPNRMASGPTMRPIRRP